MFAKFNVELKMHENLFVLQDVEYSYSKGGFHLQKINCKIQMREFITIIGPNGSGKSTLLKLLAGALKADSGKILLKDNEIQNYSKKDLAKIISIVTQFNTVIFPINVYEFVALGRSPHLNYFGYESKKDVEIIMESISKVELTSKINSPITQISGGEFQRALIARALAQEPEIILLDEATAHLDIKHQIEIFKLLKKLNDEEKLTIVFVSHNLNLADFFSNRFLLMANGKIIKDGIKEETFTSENLQKVFDAEFLIANQGGYSGVLIKK